MYHHDAATALQELREDLILADPVNLRETILRSRLTPADALIIHRLFLEYQKTFGMAQQLLERILNQLESQKKRF